MQLFEPIYSKDRSEAEIQADLYCAIKDLGLEPRLEVRGYLPESNRRKKCIFDIVVFWPFNHKPLCIIECKRGVSVNRKSIQKERYSRFTALLIYCFRNNQAEVIETVKKCARDNWNDAPPSMKQEANWAQYIETLDSGDTETFALHT